MIKPQINDQEGVEWSDGYLRYSGETTRPVAVRVSEETLRRIKQKQ